MRALLSMAILLAPHVAAAYAVARSSAGAPLHWSADAVPVALDPDTPSSQLDAGAVQRALDGALAAWSELPEARVVLARTDVAPNVIRFVEDAWPHPHDQLALTSLTAHEYSGAIASGLIEINEADHPFTADGASDRHDLQAVLTHELGHLLGLAHSADGAATMFAGTAPGDAHQRVPDADDRAGLAALDDTAVVPPVSGCGIVPQSPARDRAIRFWGFAMLAIGLTLRVCRLRARSSSPKTTPRSAACSSAASPARGIG